MADLRLEELIGVPFERGGKGPHSYDCYHLVRELYHREHGVWIPDYTSPADQKKIAALMANQLVLWQLVARTAQPGSVALFRILGTGSHVGYLLDHGRFIHTWEHSGGVLIENFHDWQHRCIGCYEYIGN